jgi:hypothetical protein
MPAVYIDGILSSVGAQRRCSDQRVCQDADAARKALPAFLLQGGSPCPSVLLHPAGVGLGLCVTGLF